MKSKIVRLLVKKILLSFTADELLKIEKGALYIGNRRLSEEEVDRLKNESERLSKMLIWQLMQKNVHYLAVERAVKGATSEKDVLFGQAMIYNLEVLRIFVEQLVNFEKVKRVR